MPTALKTIHAIKPATTDTAMRLGFVVFVLGPLRAHIDALEDLWKRLQSGFLGSQLAVFRTANRTSWARLPAAGSGASFADLFGMRGPLVGCWGLELAERVPDQNHRTGISLQLTDLAPVLGMERASHLRVLFAEQTPSATIAALGEWAINHLPLWWGSAGLLFHHTSGSMFTAHKRMAALAKRYWAVQIQDMAALQWDALRGMPGVNWLSLIGDGFAESRGMSIEHVAADAAGLEEEGVFHRKGAHGLALACGLKPLYGDINVGEDLAPYVRVAELIQPLLLTEHTPLFGPFANPEVLSAWLGRLTAPRAWLDCDIGTEE